MARLHLAPKETCTPYGRTFRVVEYTCMSDCLTCLEGANAYMSDIPLKSCIPLLLSWFWSRRTEHYPRHEAVVISLALWTLYYIYFFLFFRLRTSLAEWMFKPKLGEGMSLISRFRSKFTNAETNTLHSLTEYETLKRQYPHKESLGVSGELTRFLFVGTWGFYLC